MKKLALGTSLWGWSINKKTCFNLLDVFYSSEGRYIDTASNYPINNLKISRYFSENIISEWLKINNINDLKVIYKAGSISNNNVPLNDLSIDFLKDEYKRINEKFKSNLSVFMIHWDNRNDSNEISKTIKTILKFKDCYMGFSGLENVDLYKNELNKIDFQEPYYLEIKSNILKSNISHYKPLICNKSKIFSYGISVSGLKIDKSSYHSNSYVSLLKSKDYHDSLMSKSLLKKINQILKIDKYVETMYHIGMLHSEYDVNLYGYIVAPSTVKQMLDIIDFRLKTPSILNKYQYLIKNNNL